MAADTNTQSFWDHLDLLRMAIVKIVTVAVMFWYYGILFQGAAFLCRTCAEE